MKIKTKILLLFTLCLPAFASLNVRAQTTDSNPKGAIGITYSGLGVQEPFYFENLVGTGGYDDKGYYSLGITYTRPITRRLDLETGISYSRYKYLFSNASAGPGVVEPFDITNAIVDIPVTVRWNFLRYLFLNGGMIIGIDTGIENNLDSQSGIGAMLGIGAKYDFKKTPIGIFVNPYAKAHALIPFSPEKYNERTLENGFRFGIVYHLR
ncbi:MAG: outer membrane beta-barrel protein [Niabella sp.]